MQPEWSEERYIAKKCHCQGRIFRIATFPDGSRWKQCQQCWDVLELLDDDELELIEE